MGRPIAQHRIGRYRFMDIDDWGNPTSVSSSDSEDDVWRVESMCSESFYALKTIPLKHLTWGQRQLLSEHLSRALLEHHGLRFPHIVQLHNVFMSEHHLCAVLDWASAGSLADYADKFRGESMPERFTDSIRWFFQQLVLTLDYLHQKQPGVIQDIQLQDLLLTATDKHGEKLRRPLLKISIFKLSKYKSDRRAPTLSHQPWLTNPYASPEQRQHDDSADSLSTAEAAPLTDAVKVDVWKVGIILWTLLTGCEPDTSAWAGDMVPQDQLQAFPADVSDLLQQMLQNDPSQRLGFEGIKQHAWFVHGLPPGALQLTEQFVDAEPVCCCSRAQVEEIVQEALDVIGCEEYGDSDSDDTVC